jgi:hypothetical protein
MIGIPSQLPVGFWRLLFHYVAMMAELRCIRDIESNTQPREARQRVESDFIKI